MRAAVALLLLSGCFDFGRELERCHAEGRCPDGGTAGGGTGAGGGAGGGEGGAAGGASVASGGHCTDAGVCWDHPSPSGTGWLHAFVAGPDDAWLVGGYDSVAHFDGTRLRHHDITPLFGAAPDIFESLWSVWGAHSGGVWVAGRSAPLLYFDGGQWGGVRLGARPALERHACRGLHGAGADRVWVSCDDRLYVGGPGGMSEVSTDAGALDCHLLWADDGGVLCASPDRVLHVDNAGAATDLTPSPPVPQPFALQRSADGTLRLGGMRDATSAPVLLRHVDGGEWHEEPVAGACGNGVVGFGETADGGLVYGCGYGFVGLLDGTPFLAAETHDPGFTTVAGASGFNVAAGAGGVFAVGRGESWARRVTGDARYFTRAASREGVLYGAGTSGLLMMREPDGGWSFALGRDLALDDITGLAVTGTGLWLASGGEVGRFLPGGQPLDTVDAGAPVTRLHAVSDEVWAVTSGGAVLRYAGGWSVERDDGGTLNALWGDAPERLFAVGASGLALSRTANGEWLPESVQGAPDLISVSGAGERVWALAAQGGLFERTDAGWVPRGAVHPQCTDANHALAVTPAGDVWVAGLRELCVLRAQAQQLVPVPFFAQVDAYALHVEGGVLWILGSEASVLRVPVQ